jgi:hypothetical protein
MEPADLDFLVAIFFETIITDPHRGLVWRNDNATLADYPNTRVRMLRSGLETVGARCLTAL